MDFLLEEGISKEVLTEMKNKQDESMIDVFCLEEENVKEVIHYFQKIGIKRIDLLLINRPEIFTKDINTIKYAFLRHNVKEMVEQINNDINQIDYV